MVCQRAAMSASASSQLTRAKRASPLAPDALQRVQHAVGMVDALEIVVDLGAQRPAGERMRRIARETLGGAVPDVDHPAARVGAVMPAGAADDLDR